MFTFQFSKNKFCGISNAFPITNLTDLHIPKCKCHILIYINYCQAKGITDD